MKRRNIEIGILFVVLLTCLVVVLRYSKQAPALSSQPHSEERKEAEHTEKFRGQLTVATDGQFSPGFTLYPVVGNAKVLLLSSSGETVHSWNIDADRARLLPNCHLLVVHGTKWGASISPWSDLKFAVREYDWEGKIVWEYRSQERIHHDIQRLDNDHTLFPVRTILSKPKHELIEDKRRRRLPSIRSDYILEIGPSGNTVWKWDAEERLDINSCGKPDCSQENPSDWTHINTVSPLPENRWFDAGDSRFRPGNLLVVLRNWWTTLIIDKLSGEVVWRYEGDYKGGLSGGHDATMIEKGLPGAGNILIFDNGRVLHKGESYILEISPPTKELVWVYDVGKKFFSNSSGSVQRFANGNTLISEDLSGRVFEVTPNKEIVWEYDSNFRIARAHRYSGGYCPHLPVDN
ncbi:MAG: aryl-sulfate sulfotransferase, partial [Bdellovibrionales bacterium]|nr:aryl-sulfate sulfotransferase [Bdellovibrionales bacterium]